MTCPGLYTVLACLMQRVVLLESQLLDTERALEYQSTEFYADRHALEVELNEMRQERDRCAKYVRMRTWMFSCPFSQKPLQ